MHLAAFSLKKQKKKIHTFSSLIWAGCYASVCLISAGWFFFVCLFFSYCHSYLRLFTPESLGGKQLLDISHPFVSPNGQILVTPFIT